MKRSLGVIFALTLLRSIDAIDTITGTCCSVDDVITVLPPNADTSNCASKAFPNCGEYQKGADKNLCLAAGGCLRCIAKAGAADNFCYQCLNGWEVNTYEGMYPKTKKIGTSVFAEKEVKCKQVCDDSCASRCSNPGTKDPAQCQMCAVSRCHDRGSKSLEGRCLLDTDPEYARCVAEQAERDNKKGSGAARSSSSSLWVAAISAPLLLILG